MENKVYTSTQEFIGKTPLLEMVHMEQQEKLQSRVYAKLEYFNVTGSIKDRAALQMILDAEEKGVLKKGSVIIEPTSGNTGIALASLGTNRGYEVWIVMPETMSVERRKLIVAYGAKVILSDGSKGMKGAIDKANELAEKTPNSWVAGQFVNESNVKAHYLTTGPEIYEALQGKVDILVAGVGTGGTLTGIGKYLKEKNPDVRVVAVEPFTSAVLSHEPSGKHGIQGIGAGFIPQILNTDLIDEIVKVKDEDAYKTSKKIGIEEGVLVGISSGAAMFAALQIARKEEGKHIVVILPDSIDRYYSTPLFTE